MALCGFWTLIVRAATRLAGGYYNSFPSKETQKWNSLPTGLNTTNQRRVYFRCSGRRPPLLLRQPNAEATAAGSLSPPERSIRGAISTNTLRRASSRFVGARRASARSNASQLAHVKRCGAVRTPKMSQPNPSIIQASIDSTSSIAILRTKPACLPEAV